MPIYDFQCDKCNQIFEIFTSSMTTSTICPNCKDIMINRLISAPSFKINGHNAENGYARKPSLADKAPK